VQQRSSNSVAFVMLLSAKIFGITGFALGFTGYRPLGGALLVFDGLLLAAAVTLALRTMRSEAREEKTHKEILKQMVREGTLQQYLRDIQTSVQTAKPAC
jgi:hypothetical protein